MILLTGSFKKVPRSYGLVTNPYDLGTFVQLLHIKPNSSAVLGKKPMDLFRRNMVIDR
jgi:hypothetical protein